MPDNRYPMSDVRSSVRLRRSVAFAETDTAGIVHFSNYFRYFEDAEHALWREAGLSIHSQDSPIGWPRISASCEYHRPLKFEQDFEVLVGIAEMTSRTIRYDGTIMRDGDRVATASWTIACVDKRADGSMRSTEIPAKIRECLEPYLHRTSDIGHRSSNAHRASDTE
jgi:YbgC/YbaW family acyl-CoA thioester hydrolase